MKINLKIYDGYRFGFNGMEKDDEIFGSTGSSYTAEFWQYDSRIGRRWNLDPKPNPSISSYATFANNPIAYSDAKGDSVWVFATRLPMPEGTGKTALSVATHTFIIVKTKDGTVKHYAYGPKPDKDGNMSYTGGSQMIEVDYQQDMNVYEGTDKSNLKNKILVPIPEGMTQDEFDNAVIKTADSFGNDPDIKYNMLSNDKTTGNCNSASSTILIKSGVSNENINKIENKIDGLNWGFGDKKPWTKQEQRKATGKKEFIDSPIKTPQKYKKASNG